MIIRFASCIVIASLMTGEASAQQAHTAPAPRDPVPPHQTFAIPSNELGETRIINVYTPPSLDSAAGSTCRVLYMPDGGIAEDFPHIANAIDSLMGLGAIEPVMVVGIENTERRRDLTGPTTVPSDTSIAPRVGGSEAFRDFIRSELLPEIRTRYRCTGQTAIVGESLAGLFVVETFLLEPDLFDAYIALSPSLWWNDGELVRSAGSRTGALSGGERTLYLTSADEPEIVAGTAALADTLGARAPSGLTLYHEPRPDLQHGTIFRGAAPGAFAKVLR